MIFIFKKATNPPIKKKKYIDKILFNTLKLIFILYGISICINYDRKKYEFYSFFKININ